MKAEALLLRSQMKLAIACINTIEHCEEIIKENPSDTYWVNVKEDGALQFAECMSEIALTAIQGAKIKIEL